MKCPMLVSPVRPNDVLVTKGLQIMSEHAQMRVTDSDPKPNLFHPGVLPHRQMFELIIQIIGMTTNILSR